MHISQVPQMHLQQGRKVNVSFIAPSRPRFEQFLDHVNSHNIPVTMIVFPSKFSWGIGGVTNI